MGFFGTNGLSTLVAGEELCRERRGRHAVNSPGLGIEPRRAASKTVASADAACSITEPRGYPQGY